MRAKDFRNKAWEALRDNYWLLLAGSLIVSVVLGIANLAALILAGPLIAGLNILYVNARNKQELRLEALIDPFKDRFTNALVAGLLKQVFIMLWSLLFIIPGIVKSYSYFLTEYLIAYDKDLKGEDAIKKSMTLMNGHKGRLFFLHLSFIGWFFLGILTFGIGMFFLIPYIKMAEVEFALDLLKQNNIIENIEFSDDIEMVEEIEIITDF